jgi:transcriptional regulator with XRE-family HTH domain
MGNKRFSDQIREAVVASGVTRYRICCDIGLSQAAMSRFMTGKTGLAMDTLDRLAEYLGLSVAVRKPEAKK